MMLTRVLVATLGLLSLSGFSQKVDPYAFSGSLSSGFARVAEFDNHALLGLNGSYHRQFSKAFSLRTSLEVQYLLPNRLFQDITASSVGVSSNDYVSGSLLFGPYVHFRDKGFRLHLGLSAGLGYGYEGYRTSENSTPLNFSERRWSSFEMLQGQLNGGLLFPLNKDQAEMGIELTYFLNLDFEDFVDRIFQNGYRLNLVYHYNLTR